MKVIIKDDKNNTTSESLEYLLRIVERQDRKIEKLERKYSKSKRKYAKLRDMYRASVSAPNTHIRYQYLEDLPSGRMTEAEAKNSKPTFVPEVSDADGEADMESNADEEDDMDGNVSVEL